MSKFIQIQWTCGEIEEAREMASDLIQNKLVACVNIIPAVVSIYFWKGQIENEREVEVLLKTKGSLFEKVKDYIESKASYDVPAILSFPILGGNPDYLDWLDSRLM